MKKRFEKAKEQSPYLGDVILFNQVVAGTKLSHEEIEMWFEKLVDKKDYAGSKKGLIEYATELSNEII